MDIELLRDGLDRLGIEFDDKAIERMKTYMSEIMLFNPTYRLVGQDDEDEILIRHFLDAAAGVPYMRSLGKKTIVDLGTGAGFPGVILAILMPEVHVTLAERMSRRVAFLRNVMLRLNLKNVDILQKDASGIDRKFDIVTSRAFHPVYDCIDYVKPLLSDGGRIVFYKGPERNVEGEMAVLEDGGRKVDYEIVKLNVPYLDESRSLLVIA